MTPVKNQGHCGVCWAFGATGVMEGANFIKTGKLVALSEQNIVDCVGKYQGGRIQEHLDATPCHGGWYYWAFEYVKRNGGIDSEDSYPYQVTNQNRNCRY